jgi:hypothetical protein
LALTTSWSVHSWTGGAPRRTTSTFPGGDGSDFGGRGPPLRATVLRGAHGARDPPSRGATSSSRGSLEWCAVPARQRCLTSPFIILSLASLFLIGRSSDSRERVREAVQGAETGCGDEDGESRHECRRRPPSPTASDPKVLASLATCVGWLGGGGGGLPAGTPPSSSVCGAASTTA